MNTETLTNAIASAVKPNGVVVNDVLANIDAARAANLQPAMDLQAELAALKAENAVLAEIEKLRLENAKLSGVTTAAPSTPAKPKITATPAAGPVVPVTSETYSKSDLKLLEVLKKYQSPARTDGKVPGTFAVKVHGFLHLCGLNEQQSVDLVESAVRRHVISRMTVPTKSGKRMMLYFDYRLRPISDSSKASAEEVLDAKAAFGF